MGLVLSDKIKCLVVHRNFVHNGFPNVYAYLCHEIFKIQVSIFDDSFLFLVQKI